jgi:hypothetical protein
MTSRFHPPHLHLSSHLHMPAHTHLPTWRPRRLHLSEGARDSLWLFAALGILIVVAAAVQWLFSMV